MESLFLLELETAPRDILFRTSRFLRANHLSSLVKGQKWLLGAFYPTPQLSQGSRMKAPRQGAVTNELTVRSGPPGGILLEGRLRIEAETVCARQR